MGKPRTLIKSLENCEKACDLCASECLNEKDVISLEECITLAWDCADFCKLATMLLNRNSERKNRIIEICMDLCGKCAEECKKHDHSCCQKCAEACRLCEEHCRRYLKKVPEASGVM